MAILYYVAILTPYPTKHWTSRLRPEDLVKEPTFRASWPQKAYMMCGSANTQRSGIIPTFQVCIAHIQELNSFWLTSFSCRMLVRQLYTTSIEVEGSRTETRANRWKTKVFIFEHPDHKITNELCVFFLTNAPSVSDPFTLWKCHKAYMRGILMKISSVTKKQRNQQLSELLLQTDKLNLVKEKSPDPTISSQLDKTRHELRFLLISQHNHIAQKWKAHFYSQGNKVGKLLAIK